MDGCTPHSIECYMSALKHDNQMFGFSNDVFKDRRYKILRRGLKRRAGQNGVHPVKRFALTVSSVKKVLHTFSDTKSIDIRDKALLLLSFFGLFRRSEVTFTPRKDKLEESMLLRRHLHFNKQGVFVFLVKSKTDVLSEGTSVLVGRNRVNTNLCPVRALEHWMDHSSAAANSDPVFSTVVSNEIQSSTPFKSDAWCKRLKLLVQRVGLDPTLYSPHSLRSGGTTAYLAAKADPELVVRLGRWSSDCWKRYKRTEVREMLELSNLIE